MLRCRIILLIGVLVSSASFVSGCGGSASVAQGVPQAYVATRIGPGVNDFGYFGVNYAINNGGVVTGYLSTGNYNTVPFTWSLSGGMRRLPMPSSIVKAGGISINETGMVVGIGINTAGAIRALVWINGVPTDVGDIASGEAYLVSVNNKGVAVGWSYDIYGNGVPVSWSSSTGLVDLSPEFGHGYLNAINDSGVMAGYDFSTPGPFVYSSATGKKILATEGGLSMALDPKGDVMGQMQSGDLFYYPTGGTVTDLGPNPGYFLATVGSFNNLGDAVGSSLAPGRAWIWTQKNGIKLLSGVTAGLPPGVVLNNAFAINDGGQIVALGSDNMLYLLQPAKRAR
jgi:hypothetical protein